ncbi:MAG: recombinase family protein [Candidatus Coproplasma sp.]
MTDKLSLNKSGIYMRLSRDDEKSGESLSIENQRRILRDFVKEGGGRIVDEYVDDGWSGTDFERPAVKRLFKDAQSGRIDTIIVKDLSRFGRNYIQVGQYLDYIFPAYGIRFIALSDNVDTAERNSSAMDMMPIMNVFNEWHAANTSKKIKAVLQTSQRSGKYTGWNYPYGYRAGADSDRTAVIDEPAAEVVRRIFNLRVQGNSVRSIARILSDEGIPNPATCYVRADGKKTDRRCSPYWSSKTVAWILGNPTYLGVTTQHKTTSVSYKNHKVVDIPESERIVKYNAHAPIIDRELWERAQNVNSAVSRGRADKSQSVHALSGLLVCADCNKKLKLKSSKRKGGNCFVCRTYADLGKRYCTSHKIYESELEGLVLRDITSQLSPAACDSEKIKAHYKKLRANSVKPAPEQRLKDYQKRLEELDRLIRSAFENSVLNNAPQSLFAQLCSEYALEREDLSAEVEKLKNTLGDQGESEEEYIKRVKKIFDYPTLTRETCLQTIEFITVGEVNSNNQREIQIYYKFAKPTEINTKNID